MVRWAVLGAAAVRWVAVRWVVVRWVVVRWVVVRWVVVRWVVLEAAAVQWVVLEAVVIRWVEGAAAEGAAAVQWAAEGAVVIRWVEGAAAVQWVVEGAAAVQWAVLEAVVVQWAAAVLVHPDLEVAPVGQGQLGMRELIHSVQARILSVTVFAVLVQVGLDLIGRRPGYRGGCGGRRWRLLCVAAGRVERIRWTPGRPGGR
ncbi:hypothetical protein [Arthrobacter sp. HLT1-21]